MPEPRAKPKRKLKSQPERWARPKPQGAHQEKKVNPIVTILLSVLVFGFLIFVHEFGHYITARIFKVTILEFSIGMGPRLITWKSKKTGIQYSIAAIPFGGFVSMAGEDGTYPEDNPENKGAEEIYGPSSGVPPMPEDTEADGEPEYSGALAKRSDPNGFDKKPAWQRFIITVAGAFVNIVVGFLVMIIFTVLPRTNLGGTEIHSLYEIENLPESVTSDDLILPNDIITHINGKRVSIANELQYEITRQGYQPVDVTLIRGGKEITIPDVQFPVSSESGQSFGNLNFYVKRVDKSFGTVISHSFKQGMLMVRMCWESIFDLITGRFGFEAVSGPVGISTTIGTAASIGIEPLLYLVALISINLGFMNMLPIPALDGGRTLTTLIEMITRKRIPPKVERIINGVGLAVLLTLSAVVLIKDVVWLIFK